MRLFVSYEDAVYTLDVRKEKTVGEIKNSLQQKFGMNLKNSQNENDSCVSLVHQGSSLQDNWVYSDLGIPAGTTLVCRLEKRIPPVLTVNCPRNNETIEYKDSFPVWKTLVSTLRTMIQNSTGIHVSAFRLYTAAGVELFDCHPLKVYGVHVGDTVTMEIWRDVQDLVKAARQNDITDTLQALASFQEDPQLMCYQLQLGLFSAAHFGYHQLASQLIKCGARPNEPVGQHPSRDWCRTTAHPDHMKTPSHEAAQHGRVTCLQHFLMFNYSLLVCRDAQGLTPCNVVRRFNQTECFKLLIAEQFRIPTVSSLSIHVYSRLRKWCDRARTRARLHHKDKTILMLLSNAEVARKGAIVGQRVEVDGYSSHNHEEKSPKNASENRQRRSPVSVSSGGSAKSISKYTTRTRKTSKEGAVKRVPNRSTTPPLSASRPKQDKTRPTYDSSTKRTMLPAGLSRGLGINSDANVASTRKQRGCVRKRYVWRPLEKAQDKPVNQEKEIYRDNEGSSGIAGGQEVGDAEKRAHNHATDKEVESYFIREAKHSGRLKDRHKTETTRHTNGESRSRGSSSGKHVTNSPSKELKAREPCSATTSLQKDANVQRSTDSADKCLRVAGETFSRKSWMGQLQMALVVSTNMCKRRQSETSQRPETLESGM